MVLGNIMYYLMRLAALGDNQETRLVGINNESELCSSFSARCKKMTETLKTHLLNNGWANLHGPSSKPAVTRKATEFFYYMASKHFNDGSN